MIPLPVLMPWVWRAVAAAAVLAALALAYRFWVEHQRDIGREEIRAQWNADKLAIAEQNRILLMANAKASDKLQAEADKQRRTDHAEKHALDLRVDELRRRLRDRPERPTADPSGERLSAAAGTGAVGSGNPGCTGDRLYRDDSEALVRLAAAGDRLRIALASCRAGRERDRAAVNGSK